MMGDAEQPGRGVSLAGHLPGQIADLDVDFGGNLKQFYALGGGRRRAKRNALVTRLGRHERIVREAGGPFPIAQRPQLIALERAGRFDRRGAGWHGKQQRQIRQAREPQAPPLAARARWKRARASTGSIRPLLERGMPLRVRVGCRTLVTRRCRSAVLHLRSAARGSWKVAG